MSETELGAELTLKNNRTSPKFLFVCETDPGV